ncbi:helix-turn-helix domain-containing protein [Arthrobacter celericrescens]|uniref:helix-turn-helix domain-containing protein n=1 Tax=Arthrobacter celericrescens TaxID=2320851 RepID=UPI000EA1105C|nr:helix-turn-helix domain-containing protein [Arthrobacter celericrescens]
MSTQTTLPAWAIQRVAAALDAEHRDGGPKTAVDLARRTGLSKSLARRCLDQLRGQRAAR